MRSVPRLDMPRGAAARNHRGPAAGPALAAGRLPVRAALSVPHRRLQPGPGAARGRARATVPPAGAPTRSPPARWCPAPPRAEARGCSRPTSGTEAPLLEVEGLHKYFEIKAAGAGFLSSKTATVKAVEDVSFTIAAGRDARPRRRIGLRQDHGRPHHPQARGGDQRHDPSSPAPTSPTTRRGRCARCGARSR